MRKIVIADDSGNAVTLLPDLEYEVVPEAIGTSATMASGREVFDYIGEKNTLTIPTGWMPSADLVTLRQMIRKYHILNITYDLPEGERTDKFVVSQPTLKSFKYDDDGVSVWYGVTLSAVQYEAYT